MSYSFSEIAKRHKELLTSYPSRTVELKEKIHSGQEMAELTSDPRFMRWSLEVQKMRDHALAQTKQREERLLASLLSQDDYISVKLEQAAFRATAQAYEMALHVAKRIIEEGEKAAEELKIDT
jgi:hypothetical protein